MTVSEAFRKLLANVLGLFAVGETIDLETFRGVTTKHTPSQEKRFEFLKKAITRSNVWLLKASRGRLGNSFLGRPVLLMTTTGHKSGRLRTQPLFYVEDQGRNVLLLVASNGGSPNDPLWLKNIRTHPEVRVSRKGQETLMKAHIASSEEKALLWPKMIAAFPYWQEVSDRSQRSFPVVILEQQQQ